MYASATASIEEVAVHDDIRPAVVLPTPVTVRTVGCRPELLPANSRDNPVFDRMSSALDRDVPRDIALAIIVFPLTLYLLAGTSLLYIAYRMERTARSLADYHNFTDLLDQVSAKGPRPNAVMAIHVLGFVWRPLILADPLCTCKWHLNIPMIVFFPATFPFLLLGIAYVLALNACAALVKVVCVFSKRVLNVVRAAWDPQAYGHRQHRKLSKASRRSLAQFAKRCEQVIVHRWDPHGSN